MIVPVKGYQWQSSKVRDVHVGMPSLATSLDSETIAAGACLFNVVSFNERGKLCLS